jgi:nucleoside-diphosphate-sugar epimerase
MHKLKIGLVGLGYLGSFIAKSLLEKKYSIIATKTLDNTKTTIPDLKILPFNIKTDLIPSDIINSDIIIYNIPPVEPNFVKKFFNQLRSDQKIIFTSSISIYGPNRGIIDETFRVEENSLYAPVVLEAEKLLKNKFSNYCLLRLGGLYGNNELIKRHPIFFLEGKKEISTGEEYLHLVHAEDCAMACLNVIEKNLFPNEINIVSDLRILKKDYYIKMAQKLNLCPPEYVLNPISNPTKISNEKSKLLLNLVYKNPENYDIN